METVADLPVGQALFTPYQVNVAANEVFGDKVALDWFGGPLLESLRNPDSHCQVAMQVEKRREVSNAIILNCLDYLYGHSLLKLLNADSYSGIDQQTGLVVMVPACLRWLVPKYVAEVWVVNIPLSRSRSYFPSLHAAMEKELIRFDEVHLSLAHSHPCGFNITNFSGESPCKLDGPSVQATFVWREDRIWSGRYSAKLLGWFGLDLYWQNMKVSFLFKRLKDEIPDVKCVVAGLGKSTRFPEWIQDARVALFNEDNEKTTCRIYSESKLVIGVHGSNMLLPSAHAWATIDLMPDDRWPNLAQDILYQGENDDVRMVSWRYHFIPLKTSLSQIALLARTTLLCAKAALMQFEQGSRST